MWSNILFVICCFAFVRSSSRCELPTIADEVSFLQSHTSVLKLAQNDDSSRDRSSNNHKILPRREGNFVQAYGLLYNGSSSSGKVKETQQDPAKLMNVNANGLHDLRLVIDSAIFYGTLLLAAVALFHYLRAWYPLVYSYNTHSGDETKLHILNLVPEKFVSVSRELGWVMASMKLDLDDVDLQNLIGLDCVLLLSFLNFALKLLACIGLPMVLLFCPLSFVFGCHPAGGDLLSKIDMTVLPDGSPLFWIHALGVWYVIWASQKLIENQQRAVMAKRYRWLNEMPPPRSTTVLIQNISKTYRTEEKLKDMIDNRVFAFTSGSVEKVVFLKPAEHLKALMSDLVAAQKKLLDRREDLSDRRLAGLDENAVRVIEDKSVDKASSLEQAEKQVVKLEGEIAELERKITTEKLRIDRDERSGSAFVTFKNRRLAELFLPVRLVSSDLEFVKSIPPEPEDVLWESVLQDPTLIGTRVVGYCLLLLLFVLFTPIVGLISALTKLSYVEEVLPFVKTIMRQHTIFASAWNALFASFGLTLFMALLPTNLMWIFRKFFPAVSSSQLQLGLHKWYFAFQVVFVVFVTAVSGSIVSQAVEIAEHPSSILYVLATTLPNFTHFYLNWYVLQWFTQVLGLLRYMNLLKFISSQAKSSLLSEESNQLKAKELSEPENQDCYGMGARSAETALLLAVAIVYCSLSPIICIPALITLGIGRVIYGYLLVYAETRKPDSGGLFWHEQLQQIHAMLVLYILVMIGVVSYRSQSRWIILLVVASLPYQIYRYYLFQSSFHMESLPALDMARKNVDAEKIAGLGAQLEGRSSSYIQPELQV
mmetsp:Transcript_49267/g.77920  ORF Transcript_49267/g.77920 Transcript_49267/m.77920 type:complete len:822 (-) Transcript_49267:8-2473(-)